MFGSRQKEVWEWMRRAHENEQQYKRLLEKLDEVTRNHQWNQQSLEKALERERREARAEIKEAEERCKESAQKRLEAVNKANRLEREVRHLEHRLNLMNAEPMRYVVQSEGQEVSVIAVTHEVVPDEELVLFDRDEAVVASFKNYSSYRIEPIPAE